MVDVEQTKCLNSCDDSGQGTERDFYLYVSSFKVFELFEMH